MRKTSILLICILLVTGTFLPFGDTMASNGSIAINTDMVNVRSGPGLSYSLVKQAKRGETYPIIKEKGDWIQIQLSTFKTGWVVSWLVSRENGESKKEAAITTNTKAKAQTDQLRIRSGPGTSFQIIGLINKGEQVQILDQNENWYKVDSQYGQGWASKEFFEVSANTSSKTATSQSNMMGQVTADIVNVREEPSGKSTVAGKLTKGTNVTILSQKSDWTKVSYSNLTGWVSSEFISKESNSSTATAKKEASNSVGTITADSLNVRSDTSYNSKIVGTVSKGESYSISEEKNSWVKIEYQPGSYGWVASWYIQKGSEKTSDSSQTTKVSKITILQDGTNIRVSPEVQSDVLLRADEGDTFSVTSIQNDWYQITLANGKTGYVAGWVVSADGSAPSIVKSGAGDYLKNKTIVLDPGHGGGDNGTTGANGTLEKELTLRTARLLYDKLTSAGANVYLTRSSDTFISLPSRVRAAQVYSADAFISLHYDSSVDRSVRGMTGYYYHDFQKPLANTVYTATVGQTKMNNRGVQFGDYHVLRENNKNAVLIELGYLSNPEEEVTLKSRGFQESAASGLYEGLARYFKQ
ncbi:SH3 domain-containing protein [Neobacillus sp. Marseille-QA0830]